MRFYSKKGLVLGVIIWGSILFMIGVFLFAPDKSEGASEVIVGVSICVITSAFFAWIWFNTYYEIGDEYIKIVSGPIRSKVKISSITSIKRTRNPLSSPALSIDRLEVKHGKWDFSLISPKNEEKFCEILLEKNPNIIVNLDRKK